MVALQAWGRLEGKLRHLGEARRLFGKAAELEPSNEYVLQVCAGQGSWQAAPWQPSQICTLQVLAAPTAGSGGSCLLCEDLHDQPWGLCMPAQAWAVAENESGNTDQARALFRRATEAQPESVPAWQVVSTFSILRADVCDQLRVVLQPA